MKRLPFILLLLIPFTNIRAGLNRSNGSYNTEELPNSGELKSGVACTKAGLNTGTTVILAMDSKQLGSSGVNTSVDIKKFEDISRAIYRQVQSVNITPTAAQLQKGTIKNSILRQFKVLRNVNDAPGGEHGDINFMYSGHGELCNDPITQEEHWCLVAGKMDNEINEEDWNKTIKIDDRDKYFKIGKNYFPKSDFITEEEIMRELKPKSMFLDSCHSGKVSDILIKQKNNINNVGGTFVFAASLDTQQASEGYYTRGGYMTDTVHRIVTQMNSKVACLMDWEGNGEISDRAISVASMLAFTPPNVRLNSLESNPANFVSSNTSLQTSDKAQMVASNPNGKCFMRHQFTCPLKDKNIPKKEDKNLCEKSTNNFFNISKNINEMLKQRSEFNKYLSKELDNNLKNNQQRGLTRQDSCNQQAARGLGRVTECPNSSPATESDENNAATVFLSKFKNEIIEDYNKACLKNNNETKCSKFSQESVLKIIDDLAKDMREVLYKYP